MDDYDFIYKIILLGNDNVGKSSFLSRYVDNYFIDNPIPTIGVDFQLKMIEMEDGKKVNLQIWDSAGLERYKNIIAPYYKGVNGIILFYDIGYRESFKNLESWLIEIEKYVPKTEFPYKFLVGNKIDLETERKITTDEGEQFAKKYGLTFFESSAKTGKNVDLIFIELVKVLNKDPILQEKFTNLRMKKIEKEKKIFKNLDKYISF